MNQKKSKSMFAKRSIFARSASEHGTESSGGLEGPLSSPVTNLTFNLQVLSTNGAEQKFVRRKLSLTSSSFSESSENVSSDDGCCVDSPTSSSDCHDSLSYDSPFLQNWESASHHPSPLNEPLKPICHGSRAAGCCFKRFNSVPAFDYSSNSSNLRSTLSLTSVKEVNSSHVVEKNVVELKRGGDENKENEGIAGGGEGEAMGCKKCVSFKLPTSPAPRLIVSPFKDETNNSPAAFSRRNSSSHSSAGNVGQTNQDLLLYKSPMRWTMSSSSSKSHSSRQQLHRTSLSRKLSSDDGFLEKLQDDDGESADIRQTVPKGLEGLFFSPVLETSESESSPAANHHHDDDQTVVVSNKATSSSSFLGDVVVVGDDDGEEGSMTSSSIARGLFRSPSAPKLIRRKYSAQDIRISYKRSESHTQDSDLTPLQLKRWKGGLAKEREGVEKEEEEKDGDGGGKQRNGPAPAHHQHPQHPRRITRCHSETEIFIKTALNWADSQQNNLIGDFSKPFCLPLLVNGKHQDLKAISPATMAAIVNNDYKDVMDDCIVVDCRYPYEFLGGHIPGARNVYTTDDLIEMFFTNATSSSSNNNNSSSGREVEASPSTSSSSSSSSGAVSPPSGYTEKRSILIFHCEFSSERGPKLSRFLRNHDRDANIDSYPTLRYPEIYVLEGGYKAFYESFPHLCEPHGYVPMLHQDHLVELKQFRSKSSSWTTTEKGGGRVLGRKTATRPSLNLC